MPGFLTDALAETGVPFVLLIDLVLAMPFDDGVVVDVRDGLRFVTPGDKGGLTEALRPVEPGGGGFFVAVVDILTNSGALVMVKFLELRALRLKGVARWQRLGAKNRKAKAPPGTTA